MSNDAKLERCQAATAAQKIPTRGEMSGIRLVHRAPELGRQRGNLARNLEALWRFCFPTAVDFDPKTDRIIVADSQRNRLQIYRKVRDYVEFQANL